MMHLLLFFTYGTTFLYSATCYRVAFDGGIPRNNRLSPVVFPGTEEQSSFSRLSRQNRFFSSGGNNRNQFLGFGNSRPNSDGFNWENSQNNVNEQPRPNQNNFNFENNDNNVNEVLRPNRPSTTRRPPSSTIAIPGMATTRSACEDSCRATTQFDPVCGNNNITYTNINWLRCAQQCGRNVRVKYAGACPRVA